MMEGGCSFFPVGKGNFSKECLYPGLRHPSQPGGGAAWGAEGRIHPPGHRGHYGGPDSARPRLLRARASGPHSLNHMGE